MKNLVWLRLEMMGLRNGGEIQKQEELFCYSTQLGDGVVLRRVTVAALLGAGFACPFTLLRLFVDRMDFFHLSGMLRNVIPWV